MAQRPNEKHVWVRDKIMFNERDTERGPTAPDVSHSLEFNIRRIKWDDLGPGNSTVKQSQDVEATVLIELDHIPASVAEVEKLCGKGWTTAKLAEMRQNMKEDT